jgi:hypothetical protein
MANSQEAMAVAQWPPYQSRVGFYAIKSAIAIMAEDAATPSHAERVVWANSELAGEELLLTQSVSTVSNPTIMAEADISAPLQGIPDADLEFAVTSDINAWAGVSQV